MLYVTLCPALGGATQSALSSLNKSQIVTRTIIIMEDCEIAGYSVCGLM